MHTRHAFRRVAVLGIAFATGFGYASRPSVAHGGLVQNCSEIGPAGGYCHDEEPGVHGCRFAYCNDPACPVYPMPGWGECAWGF
jgi:hypothetical protein